MLRESDAVGQNKMEHLPKTSTPRELGKMSKTKQKKGMLYYLLIYHIKVGNILIKFFCKPNK